MLGILLLTETPSDSTWTTVKNKWEQVAPLLGEFNKVPDTDISKVRDLMLRMNLFDLKGINVATGIQISQTIVDRDIAALRDELKDLARTLQLLLKATSIEISNLQGEIEALSSFISPQPAPANDLLFATANDFAHPENSLELRPEVKELNEEVASLRVKYMPDWCFAWFGEMQLSAGMKDLAGVLKDARWKRGEEITISFLEGDEALRERVRKVAREWTGPNMANLALSFRNDTNATDIRISFQPDGSWSMIGNTCRSRTDTSKATMNLRLTADSSEQQVRRLVLHEFGHALGLIHEHQVPNGGFKWNRDAVIRDLSGLPNEWTPQQIEDNIFKAFTESQVHSTGLDIYSIMIYPIPSTWLLDGQPIPFNTELSAKDKQFIREQYPHS